MDWVFLLIVASSIRVAMAAGDVKPSIIVLSGGATLPVDVYKIWRPMYQSYRSAKANVEINYQPVGTVEGITRFNDDNYDFAGVDFEIEEDKYGNSTDDLQMFPTVAGTVSLTYNVPELPNTCIDHQIPNNPSCLNLTREAIVGIFNGSITHWNDTLLVEHNPVLRNVNRSIAVVVRADPAGPTLLLTQTLSAFSHEWKHTYGSFSDGCTDTGQPTRWNSTINVKCGLKTNGAIGLVINTEYSIGYCGSSEAQDSLLSEARIMNRAGQWINPSVEATEAVIEALADSLGSRLTGSLTDAAARNAYPIAGYSYFLIRKKSMTNCTIAQEIYRFFLFILNDPLAKNVVRDLVKAPVSERVYELIEKQVLAKMECKGIKVSELVKLTIAIEDGTLNSWKIYSSTIAAVIVVITLITGGSLGYIHYQQNKYVLTNAYILNLDPTNEETRKSHASFHSSQYSGSRRESKYGPDDVLVKIAGGERGLAKPLCKHLEGETLQWSSRKLLVRMKFDLSHANVLKVLGITKRDNQWHSLTACPRKGTLQDVLHEGKYQMDTNVRSGIVHDLAEGMTYLHRNHFIHGQLTTACCYIDARWNALVGDWEQHALHSAQKVPFIAFEAAYRQINESQVKDPGAVADYCRRLYYTPSELLVADAKNIYRIDHPSKQGDVYSFGVVAFETFTGNAPFDHLTKDHQTNWQPTNVVKAIKTENLTPAIPSDLYNDFPKIVMLLRQCWELEPSYRPTFMELKKALRSINPKHESIIDTMIQSVEAYASSLEDKVNEKTADLEKVTQNMELIMHSLLPPALANRLTKGETILPETYDSTTVCFLDIVDFTALVASSRPADFVSMLNDLYSAFDLVLGRYDVHKVETIGSSYLVVSGVPRRNGQSHALEIGTMALDILSTAKTFSIPYLPAYSLRIRIGAHSGMLIAGVVGLKVPRYCLFGETVTVAAKLEATSMPMRIHISATTRSVLEKSPIFTTRPGNDIDTKAARMATWWLIGKLGFNKPLPSFDESSAG